MIVIRGTNGGVGIKGSTLHSLSTVEIGHIMPKSDNHTYFVCHYQALHRYVAS